MQKEDVKLMIQLLAVDMDGTCLNDKKRISDKTLSALKRASEAGITVVPTTGRALKCLPFQLRDEHFFRYVISSNGACATDLETNQSLYASEIPYGEVLELLHQCRKLKLGISVHVKHQFLLQGELLSWMGRVSYGKDMEDTVCEKDIAAFLEREKLDVEEVQLFFFSKHAREKLRRLLEGYPQLAQAWTDRYVELYSPMASKGNALAALAKHLGIPKEQIGCIGDAENDFSMFAASGMRYAMGNAIPKLKERADMLLPSNNDDGVARAIEYLFEDM